MRGAKPGSRLDPASIPDSPDLSLESCLWQAGLRHIGGIDEAGRGALAGPVSAAVVVLPTGAPMEDQLKGVRDSKQMTARQRQMWAERIRQQAADCAVGFASAQEIDLLGILPATRLAAQRAVDALTVCPDHLMLDCLFLPDNPLPQTSLIKGDQRSLSIAAASVLAKTARDELMRQLDEQFPGYGLTAHKGYGTLRHRRAIQNLGPTVIHRCSFNLTGGLDEEEMDE